MGRFFGQLDGTVKQRVGKIGLWPVTPMSFGRPHGETFRQPHEKLLGLKF